MGHRLHGVSTLQDSMEFTDETTILNYNDDFIFHPVYSPKTHALVSIESVEKRENTPIFSNRGIKVSVNVKETVNDLLTKSGFIKKNFDTILAFREMTWSGIQGIEKISSSCFKGVFTAEYVNSSRNNQSDETIFIKRNLFQVPGPPFTHIQQPYRSYYIGSNTPLDDPDYYLDCLRELVIVYRRDIACGPDFGMHAGEELQHPPKIALVEAIDPSKVLTKYTAADHRTLALLSYFYSTPAMLSKQENTKWWQFDKPLIHHSPWCLDWTKGLTKGVFVFSGDVPWSQLLYALNGSIVGLVGNILDVDVDESCEMVDKMVDEIADKMVDEIADKIVDEMVDEVADKMVDEIVDEIADKSETSQEKGRNIVCIP
ncbi:7293_t:CDS:2 [Racocetra fulgida]|uniref:7292_t:CDS:1 n=1 Tax=Racocetra fulgida TaxID=60492 RepID=A0A9N8ZCX6_9GLOM|nr:7292_t:CDS:2 [Racocetra fulgida]CAG8485158.1 7293_t:CDS:2 [Racocetra fulgida]